MISQPNLSEVGVGLRLAMFNVHARIYLSYFKDPDYCKYYLMYKQPHKKCNIFSILVFFLIFCPYRLVARNWGQGLQMQAGRGKKCYQMLENIIILDYIGNFQLVSFFVKYFVNEWLRRKKKSAAQGTHCTLFHFNLIVIWAG